MNQKENKKGACKEKNEKTFWGGGGKKKPLGGKKEKKHHTKGVHNRWVSDLAKEKRQEEGNGQGKGFGGKRGATIWSVVFLGITFKKAWPPKEGGLAKTNPPSIQPPAKPRRDTRRARDGKGRVGGEERMGGRAEKKKKRINPQKVKSLSAGNFVSNKKKKRLHGKGKKPDWGKKREKRAC